MRKIAIITAAGYKGVSTQFPDVPERCPEAFLPLGDTTILGRQVRQLNELGFECHVTVGRPGCLYNWASKWAPKAYKFNNGEPFDNSRSPWTKERVDYAHSLGASVIIIDEPDGQTAQDSICIAIDKIGYEWDKLFLTQGDHIYTDSLVEAIVKHPFPCQIRQRYKPKRYDTVFVLDPEAAKVYRRFAKTHRKRGMRAWFGSTEHELGDVPTKDGRSTGEVLCDRVMLRYVHEHFHYHDHYEWPRDVDSPLAYWEALCWYRAYGRGHGK